MATHVLIIHPRLDFVVTLKQALERAGGYDVHPFTSADTAVDYLRYHPQDVALVDLNLTPVGGLELVRLLRAVQRDLAIIISPRQPASVLGSIGVQGSVDMPIAARQLIPVLDEALARMAGKPDDTETLTLTRPSASQPLPQTPMSAAPASEEDEDTSLEIVVTDTPMGPTPAPETPSTFDRLAAEEPPMPTFEDSGTVRDLKAVVNPDNVREVVSLLTRSRPLVQRTPPIPRLPEAKAGRAEEGDESTENIPAQVILENALDETTPLSLALTNIQKQLSEANISIDEPDFLAEIEGEDDSLEYGTEQAVSERLEPAPVETERYPTPPPLPPKPAVPPPPPTLPETQAPSGAVDDMLIEEEEEARVYTRPFTPEEIRELAADFEKLAAFDLLPDDVEIPQIPTELEEKPDPEAARLALRLTQASLELAAEATLLAKNYKIVAYAGTLPREEVEALGEAVANDWHANPNEARMRFKTLPSSGKDYLLYSRRTEGDYTLTMIFGGAQSLQSIRRQGQRLLDALEAVPEAPAAEPEVVQEAPSPPEVAVVPYSGPMTAYTCLWLVRDPEQVLSSKAMKALNSGLAAGLRGAHWDLKAFDVHEDYVYLFADVPGELPGQEVIRELKRRAGELAAEKDKTLDPQTLWLDSYLVITPGRNLTQEEIQQFIRFARM
jgi:CheY-like chemotaxis protein/REP element-mobilizing transposase RayT